jgi:hypothetical protein
MMLHDGSSGFACLFAVRTISLSDGLFLESLCMLG